MIALGLITERAKQQFQLDGSLSDKYKQKMQMFGDFERVIYICMRLTKSVYCYALYTRPGRSPRAFEKYEDDYFGYKQFNDKLRT